MDFLKKFNFSLQNPTSIAQLVIGALVAVNLVAAYFMMRPPGGSPEELQAEVRDTTAKLHQQRAVLERTKVLVGKIESGRQQGDQFLSKYFLPSGIAYSTVFADLIDLAKDAQMKTKESTYNVEEIDGSDTLSTMTITQSLEGTYPQLIHFINALDKSPRLLVVESLQATPQASGGLAVQMKLQTYVREDATSQ
jgi:type IV pilus assembly protein PilO